MIPRLRVPKPGTIRDYVRARTASPAISREVVANILRGAELGRPTSVRNAAHGWRTSVVMVESGDRRFVVRRYPDRWTDAAIEHEHSLLRELAGRDFPAPRLIELADGSFLRVIDGARYSVQTFEMGVTLAGFYLSRPRTARLQRFAGGVLAGFHRVTAGFVPRGRHHLGVDPTTGLRRRDLGWHLDVIERLRLDRDVGASFGSASEIASVRTRLVELDRLIADAHLPLVIIHGDYGLHNIIFRPSGEAVVHDFELSRLDLRLLDLAAALSRIKPRSRPHLLTGLLEADGVDASELDMLEPVWEWYRIRGAIQSAEAYMRLGGEHRRGAVVKRLAEAAELRSGCEMVPG